MKNQHSNHQKLSLKHKIIASSAAIFAALLIVPLTISAQTNNATTTAMPIDIATTTVTILPLPNKIFIAPKVGGISAAIYDPTSKTFIYEKNDTAVRSIASLTKILTAIVTKDIITQQKNPTKIITLNKIIPETIADRQLKAGEQWKIQDLLHYMLTTSSNTAAETIGGQILPYNSFISLMNYKAKTLGLTSIKASNMSGLPIYSKVKGKTVESPGAVGSAKDVALLMAEAYKSYPDLIAYTANYNASFTSTLKGKTVTHLATSTNELLATVPNIIGGKTGFTEASGGNLAVVFLAPEQRPLIIVVLGSTVEGRFADVTALASSSVDFFTVK